MSEPIKLRAFESDEGPIVAGTVADLIDDTYFGEIFSDFDSANLAATIDYILVTRHGNRIILPEMLEEFGENFLWYWALASYLRERAPWIRQQMAYIEAEYNPIENYSQPEVETVDFDRKKRTRDITNTENAYSRTRTRQNPQVITEQYTEANIVSTTAQTQTTAEHKVAPFDSSTYHAESKDETTPGTITSTEQPYNRKFKTPQNTVTDTEALAAPKVETQKIEDAAYKDQDKRDLTRSGNIGVQTAAQMMSLDNEFWDKNRWLSQMALDIVNLLCEQVEVI